MSLPPITESFNPLVTLSDYEPYARAHLSHMAYEYIAGGAGDEFTMRANREAFDHIKLRPRMLVDVSNVDTSCTVFGQEMSLPVLLAPCAYQKLMHPDGEVETVRGANAAGVSFVLSTSATASVEECAAAATQPLWFQLYTTRDRGFMKDLVDRAINSGAKVLVVTVDAPIRGIRDRDSRCCFELPKGFERPNLRGLDKLAVTGNARPVYGSIYSPNLDPTFTWKDLEWLRARVKVPMLIKGILTGEDAGRAASLGLEGVIVSNHGGRTVDTLPGAMEALPEVVAAVEGRVTILLDGGVRRGTDVIKAIASGCSAVLIGRPYLYALAINGAEGVRKVVEILKTELEMAMALCGRTRIAEIDRSILWQRQL